MTTSWYYLAQDNSHAPLAIVDRTNDALTLAPILPSGRTSQQSTRQHCIPLPEAGSILRPWPFSDQTPPWAEGIPRFPEWRLTDDVFECLTVHPTGTVRPNRLMRQSAYNGWVIEQYHHGYEQTMHWHIVAGLDATPQEALAACMKKVQWIDPVKLARAFPISLATPTGSPPQATPTGSPPQATPDLGPCCQFMQRAYVREEMPSGTTGSRKRTWKPIGYYCHQHGFAKGVPGASTE